MIYWGCYIIYEDQGYAHLSLGGWDASLDTSGDVKHLQGIIYLIFPIACKWREVCDYLWEDGDLWPDREGRRQQNYGLFHLLSFIGHHPSPNSSWGLVLFVIFWPFPPPAPLSSTDVKIGSFFRLFTAVANIFPKRKKWNYVPDGITNTFVSLFVV